MWGTHLTWTLGSILFFSAIHAVAHVAFLKFLSPAKRAALSFDDRISLSEKVSSSVHAVFVASCGIYLTFMTDAFDTDLWGSFPPLLDYAFPVYLGYSLYDMGTMVFQTNHWTLWAHHVFGVLGSYIMITNQAGALYPTSFMVTEITALSDNLNWYTKTLVLPYLAEPSRSFWRNTALPRLRAASFILCRVWIPPYVIIKSAIISGGWIELAKGWLSLKWYISIPGFTILILFTLLNFAWTHAITMKCFKKSHASPKLTGYEEVSDSPNELKKRMVEKKR